MRLLQETADATSAKETKRCVGSYSKPGWPPFKVLLHACEWVGGDGGEDMRQNDQAQSY